MEGAVEMWGNRPKTRGRGVNEQKDTTGQTTTSGLTSQGKRKSG